MIGFVHFEVVIELVKLGFSRTIFLWNGAANKHQVLFYAFFTFILHRL